MFCPECGHKIEEDARFCPECGTRVDSGDAVTSKPVLQKAPEEQKGKRPLYGLVFTNIGILSEKLRAEASEVKGLLESFIEYKKSSGVYYRLIDAGNYSYGKAGLFSRERTVHLHAGSSLEEYMDILMDVHRKEGKAGKGVSEYLFIIGGNDVIPMPKIRHYIRGKNHSDKDIETDILYSWPYGEEMVSCLERMEAFRYDQLFHVGRLPLGADTSAGDLTAYLQRDVDNSAGIPLDSAYGQCDPNWKNVSVRVAQDLAASGLLPDLGNRLSCDSYYRRMILSPMITSETVSRVLNTGASLYYFNLHGGEGRNMSGYFGQTLKSSGGEWFTVLTPRHLGMCLKANAVVSEACYGARFTGLDKSHSMLLSAMSASSLVFLGSSRVAWGSVDGKTATPENTPVGFADILAATFLRSVLQGKTAGEALFDARKNIFSNYELGEPIAALTVVEFNLFGDPSLGFSNESSIYPSVEDDDCKSFVPGDAEMKITACEPVTDGSEGNSVLDMVRNAVDTNINAIHSMISEYLYGNYNVEVRKPDDIFRIRFSDGREEFRFTYSVGTSGNDIKTGYMVTATPQGKINNVFSTK